MKYSLHFILLLLLFPSMEIVYAACDSPIGCTQRFEDYIDDIGTLNKIRCGSLNLCSDSVENFFKEDHIPRTLAKRGLFEKSPSIDDRCEDGSLPLIRANFKSKKEKEISELRNSIGNLSLDKGAYLPSHQRAIENLRNKIREVGSRTRELEIFERFEVEKPENIESVLEQNLSHTVVSHEIGLNCIFALDFMKI